MAKNKEDIDPKYIKDFTQLPNLFLSKDDIAVMKGKKSNVLILGALEGLCGYYKKIDNQWDVTNSEYMDWDKFYNNVLFFKYCLDYKITVHIV